ncbi:DNA-binding CsgD family transcriptional regulator [Microbacterium terrae]|nr:AAA family ATPase [Microbacterium terrae]MBP1078166.1 DNA-binding CsgD family transcriptional regulator [Microbacterium terrae]
MRTTGSAAVMVGRDAEMTVLRDAFDAGHGGRTRAVIVRGEAGIGKTRLVQEFASEITRGRGDDLPAVAFGQCVDLGPIGAPFGPIARILRDLHDAVGSEALRSAMGSPAVAAAIVALARGLSELADPGQAPAGSPAEAIEVVLENLSRTRHVVIVLEDLQWADAATLGLLKTLAGSLREGRMTIVATYRSDDVDRFHPLRPVLAELERMRRVQRIEIAPLGPDEVAEQVALLARGAIGPDDLTMLAERSGGIPFLVEELVDLDDVELPDTLRELVLARYARLSPEAREIVRVMAAGGVDVGHELLRAVAGTDEEALDRAVRESIDARVVVAAGDGYAFRHALTQEAVESEMLPSERIRVHRRYAEELARTLDDAPDAVSAVAEHWLAARAITPAFDATVLALGRSQATFSPATSARLLERLTELWPQVPDAAERSGMSLARLQLRAADAWHDLSEAERALRAANEGISVCDDPVTLAGLLRHKWVQEANTGRRPGDDDLQSAIGLLRDRDEPEALVLLSRIMTNLAMSHGPEAVEHLERAIGIAEEADDAPALAVALNTLGWHYANDEDDPDRALAPLERAIALPLDPAMRVYVASTYVDMLSLLGRFREAAVAGAAHHTDAVRSGIERGVATGLALSVAHASFAIGEPDQGIRYAQRARRLLDPPGRSTAVRMLATHYAWNDAHDERVALLAAERESLESVRRKHPAKRGWWVDHSVDSVLTAAAGIASMPDEGTMGEMIPRIVESLDDDGGGARRRYAAVGGALLVRALRDSTGDLAAGRDALRARIEASMAEWPQRGTAPTITRFISATFADADGADPSARAAGWRDVADAIADGGMPLRYHHVAQLSLAAALIEAGRRAEALGILDRIIADAPRHGVSSVARWATTLRDQAGLSSRAAAGDDAQLHGLTPRERQVLALVADGLTNAEIGNRLFISPKTASVHVSAILAKVGARSRTEAAARYASSSPESTAP